MFNRKEKLPKKLRFIWRSLPVFLVLIGMQQQTEQAVKTAHSGYKLDFPFLAIIQKKTEMASGRAKLSEVSSIFYQFTGYFVCLISPISCQIMWQGKWNSVRIYLKDAKAVAKILRIKFELGDFDTSMILCLRYFVILPTFHDSNDFSFSNQKASRSQTFQKNFRFYGFRKRKSCSDESWEANCWFATFEWDGNVLI